MRKAYIKNKLYLLILLSAAGLINFNGCDDSGIEPKTTVDTNVVRYYNISPTYWFQGTNDTSHMGVNLLEGDEEINVSSRKDMTLIDFQSDTVNFLFRSGIIDDRIPLGYATRFNRIYANIDSAKFDSLSVIPDSDNNLTPDDFTQNDTWGNGAWQYFAINQAEKPVYSFYLQGRNISGTNFIYGVFHVRKVERVYSPPVPESYGVKITIDIKLNNAGKNHFKP